MNKKAEERERLAQALRANLRRRKAVRAPVPPPAPDQEQADERPTRSPAAGKD